LIKTESQDWERFKTLSRELFHGDDTTTFREAVLALISLRQKQDTSRLRAIIDKIRSDIESAGGSRRDKSTRWCVNHDNAVASW
jgi:hypothetical protein